MAVLVAWLLGIPAVTIVSILIVRRNRWAEFANLAAATLCLVLTLAILVRAPSHPVVWGDQFLLITPIGAWVLLCVGIVYFLASLYAIGYMRLLIEERQRLCQFYSLFAAFALTMFLAPVMNNPGVYWIAIDLTTIVSAFLVGFERAAESAEAAWKYIIIVSAGLSLALLGIVLFYWAGTFVFGPVYAMTWAQLRTAAPDMPKALMLLAYLLTLIGFGTKVGLVPMHTWLPDAHSQAPASVCAVLSGVETSAALYMLLRIYPVLASNSGVHDPAAWYMAAGLITVGSAAFMLLQVHDFKRMFAYSTIEHMGIILTACGIGAAVHEQGTVYQLFAHGFTKSLCFYAAGLAGIVFGTQEIAKVRGLISRAPAVGWALVIGTLAIAGAPPFALFLSEFEILYTGFRTGQYLPTGLLTAFIVLAFIALAYQASRIAFGEPATAADGRPLPKVRLPRTSLAAMAMAIIPVFIFGFYLPPPLAHLVHQAAYLLEVHG